MLTRDELTKLLIYDEETGLFYSRVNTNRWKHGQLVGSKHKDGYLTVMISGKNYLLHRLAFLYMQGTFPEKHVDHINRNRSDNRWQNLREADSILNNRNTSIGKNNTSGVKGVYWNKKAQKWQAFIGNDSKPIYLGLFEELDDAVKARSEAEEKYEYPI